METSPQPASRERKRDRKDTHKQYEKLVSHAGKEGKLPERRPEDYQPKEKVKGKAFLAKGGVYIPPFKMEQMMDEIKKKGEQTEEY